jgi:hypothetical protein
MMILGGGLYSFFSQTQSSKMSLPSRANRTSMFSAMNGRGNYATSGEPSKKKARLDKAGLCSKETLRPAYATLTSMAFGFAFSDFGR